MKQFMKQLLCTLFGILFLSISVSATELEYYGIKCIINDDMTAKHEILFKFSEPVKQTRFEYQINFKIYNFSASADFSKAKCRIIDLKDAAGVSCDLKEITKEKNTLTFTFYTKDTVRYEGGRYQFIGDYTVPFPVKNFFILIRLPTNGILAEEIANESYFPGDGGVLTDGKHIMVYWERENLTPRENLKFSIFYNLPVLGDKKIYNITVIILTVLILITMIVVAIYLRKEKTTQVVRSVLNKDEKIIVDILHAHGGEAGQKVLVRESDFSKAKVSRIVKGLAERNVVEVQPLSGRENKVILKIKKD